MTKSAFKHRSRLQPASQAASHQLTDLSIHDMTHDGRGVARWQGKAVFVEGALQGELVDAQVLNQKSQYVEAKLTKVIEASEARIEPECQHAAVCGGCQLAHWQYDAQIQFKTQQVEKALLKHGFDALPWQAPLLGEQWHYRRRTRWLVNRQNQLCYRAQGGKNAVIIESCPQLTIAMSEKMQALQTFLLTWAVHPVDEVELTHVGHWQLSIYTNVHWQQGMVALWQDWCDQQKIDGLMVYQQHIRQQPVCIVKPTDLFYALSEGEIRLSVDQFVQAQESVNTQLAVTAAEWLSIGPQSNVLELFSGAGNFSMLLAKQSGQFLGLEISEKSVQNAQENAVRWGLTHTKFAVADLFDADWRCPQGITHVLLDPPRDGALHACQQLVKRKSIERIVYVSCHPASFARDAAVLKSAGYQLTKVALADQFAQTYHAELISLWEKGK